MQVGLTFNFMHGETEEPPESSGTGSSDFQAEFDFVEQIKTVSGVCELLQKTQPGILFATTRGFADPCCEGYLPLIHENISIQSTGPDNPDSAVWMNVEKSFSFGDTYVGRTRETLSGAHCNRRLQKIKVIRGVF